MELGGCGRRLHRHVGLNSVQDVVLCWWNQDESSEELWPWTPTDTHRNNLVLISCSPAEGLKVYMHTHTEHSTGILMMATLNTGIMSNFHLCIS